MAEWSDEDVRQINAAREMFAGLGMSPKHERAVCVALLTVAAANQRRGGMPFADATDRVARRLAEGAAPPGAAWGAEVSRA